MMVLRFIPELIFRSPRLYYFNMLSHMAPTSVSLGMTIQRKASFTSGEKKKKKKQQKNLV